MTKKHVVIAVGVLVADFALGYFIGKKRERAKIYKHLEEEYAKTEDVEDAVNPIDEREEFVVEQKNDYTAYKDMAKDLLYVTEDEIKRIVEEQDMTDDEEESYRESVYAAQYEDEYRKEHAGKIEVISEKEFDAPNRDIEYEQETLFYFKETDDLTNEDGKVLYPHDDYVGDWFHKTLFKTSDEDKLYIRNNILERDYEIQKRREHPSEFFYEYEHEDE